MFKYFTFAVVCIIQFDDLETAVPIDIVTEKVDDPKPPFPAIFLMIPNKEPLISRSRPVKDQKTKNLGTKTQDHDLETPNLGEKSIRHKPRQSNQNTGELEQELNEQKFQDATTLEQEQKTSNQYVKIPDRKLKPLIQDKTLNQDARTGNQGARTLNQDTRTFNQDAKTFEQLNQELKTPNQELKTLDMGAKSTHEVQKETSHVCDDNQCKAQYK